jgi:hypothetical protein
MARWFSKASAFESASWNSTEGLASPVDQALLLLLSPQKERATQVQGRLEQPLTSACLDGAGGVRVDPGRLRDQAGISERQLAWRPCPV